jgi:hypothetical protein
MLKRLSFIACALLASVASAQSIAPLPPPVSAPALDEWGLVGLGVLIVAVARFAVRWKK